MSSTCHFCEKPVDASANRCRSCGRSLVVKQGTAAYTPSPTTPGGAATGAHDGGGFSDYIVHVIIALITGAASFALVAIVFRRALFSDDSSGMTLALVFVLGFGIPAAYAFYSSFKKSQEAQERKRHGLARTPGFTNVAEGTSTKAYVPPTRVNVPTPHYERTKLEYLPGGCALNDEKLQAWRELLGAVPDENKIIPRNYLFTSLEGGDAQPGIIVHSDADLIIASAYSDEFDNYVFIGFAGRERAKLESEGMSTVGTRLACVWKYAVTNPMEQTDIIRGKNSSSNFASGEVAIIDLLSSDTKRLDLLKRKFGDKMYATVLDGSRQLLASGKVSKLRSGSPLIGSYAYMDYRSTVGANA